MEITPDVIMWTFGLVFTAFSGLGGIIWWLMWKYIETTHASAMEAIQRVEDEASRDREGVRQTNIRIFDKLEQIQKSLQENTLRVAENYATKDDVRRALEDKTEGKK